MGNVGVKQVNAGYAQKERDYGDYTAVRKKYQWMVQCAWMQPLGKPSVNERIKDSIQGKYNHGVLPYKQNVFVQGCYMGNKKREKAAEENRQGKKKYISVFCRHNDNRIAKWGERSLVKIIGEIYGKKCQNREREIKNPGLFDFQNFPTGQGNTRQIESIHGNRFVHIPEVPENFIGSEKVYFQVKKISAYIKKYRGDQYLLFTLDKRKHKIMNDFYGNQHVQEPGNDVKNRESRRGSHNSPQISRKGIGVDKREVNGRRDELHDDDVEGVKKGQWNNAGDKRLFQKISDGGSFLF